MNHTTKYSAVALLLSALLFLLTIVLHPVGGDLEYLRKISTLIRISHGIALLSLPLAVYGYWGLTNLLFQGYILAPAGFIFICFGYTAVLVAAALNGLVLPIFIEEVHQSSSDISSINLILDYNFSLNQAFDLIFIWAHCLAFLIWSFGILRTRFFPTWIAYAGIVLSLFFIVYSLFGFNLDSVISLRYFVVAIIAWGSAIGIEMFKRSKIKE